VILGQDPYHGKQQAHGLSFSVLPPTPPPPSLVNIFKELKNEIPDFVIPSHGNYALRIWFWTGFIGDLTAWASRGVLLLNTVLTVTERSANSHRGKGWEKFTDKIISLIDEEREKVNLFLFLFLMVLSHRLFSSCGENQRHSFYFFPYFSRKNRAEKSALVRGSNHIILTSPHPSPYSADRVPIFFFSSFF